MKKILLMALFAATLFACSNEDNEKTEETRSKSLEFTLGIASPKTRMADESVTVSGVAAAVREHVESITIEYFNSASASLGRYDFSSDEIATVKSDDQNKAFGDSGRKPVRINNIPSATTKVNVYLNVKTSGDINDLQTANNIMEYRGEEAADLQLVSSGTGTNGNDVYRVEVPVKPVLTRFEFSGDASDIVINKDGSGSLPTGITNGTKAEAQSHVNDITIDAAEKAARDAWKNAHPGVAEPSPWEYKYTVTYAYNTAYDVNSITGYYMNNIPLTKGGLLVLNGNNAGGDWDAAAKGNYNASGSMKKMYDEAAPAVDKRISYNLFPQTVAAGTPTVMDVKKEMPHFILRLTTNGTPAIKWITIRALKTTGASELVKSFDAGKVYVLAASEIKINQYTATLTVTANDTEGPEKPEDKDPTDPNPEPVGKDIEVLVKILDWEAIPVKPEW
jgi:hypothetical protein